MVTGDRRGDFRPLSIRSVIARAGDPVRAQPLYLYPLQEYQNVV